MKWLACVLVVSVAHAADVPPQAIQYLPTLSQQVQSVMPGFFAPQYFGGLIEHESGCPSLPKMCWNPKARLKTSREEGAGLGQITRAYREDGSERFDALTEARKLDPKGLNELRWENVYERPDLQIRTIVLMSRQNWNRLISAAKTDEFRLQLTDLAYNAGVGRSMNDMRSCSLQSWCDPQKWYGNVEKTCTASTRPIYGTRSACDISRHHVDDVVRVRMPKYERYVCGGKSSTLCQAGSTGSSSQRSSSSQGGSIFEQIVQKLS